MTPDHMATLVKFPDLVFIKKSAGSGPVGSNKEVPETANALQFLCHTIVGALRPVIDG
jgi:hypothetical protein